MARYWVSWWTPLGEYDDLADVPFECWVSGSRGSDEDERQSIVAMIDAESEEQIWARIDQLFPACEHRFCSPQKSDAVPNNRFLGSHDRTSLFGE